MTSPEKGWWRADGWLPHLSSWVRIFSTSLYTAFPDYRVFLATDYSVRLFSLTLLYFLLRGRQTPLPIPWRLSAPSARDLLLAVVGTLILIAFNVLGTRSI